MPDATTNAPNASDSLDEWVSVATVAARLGVSERAVQKRCASGTLPARRVPGARGEVWEVEALTANFKTNTNANLSPNPNTVRRQVRAQLPLPVANEREGRTNQGELDGEGRTFESERERELKDEVRFLRGLVEQHARAEAELRATIREMAKAQPKQLTQGSATTPENGTQSNEASSNSQQEESGGAIEADGAGTDEMSADELLKLCRRITR